MTKLLAKQGILCGLLFNTFFEKEGPPFGGEIKAYKKLFSKYFYDVSIEPTDLSIPPRRGREVFIKISNPVINSNDNFIFK
ncbi:MAG TPA: hypothetical protein PKD85_23540, partial [Saprospiraceae bacterium]|nr:hypothetical protein [Saprospiraceae bacterium]